MNQGEIFKQQKRNRPIHLFRESQARMGTIGTTPVLRWETDPISPLTKRFLILGPLFFCLEAIVPLLPTLGFVWKGWPAPKPAHG